MQPPCTTNLAAVSSSHYPADYKAGELYAVFIDQALLVVVHICWPAGRPVAWQLSAMCDRYELVLLYRILENFGLTINDNMFGLDHIARAHRINFVST